MDNASITHILGGQQLTVRVHIGGIYADSGPILASRISVLPIADFRALHQDIGDGLRRTEDWLRQHGYHWELAHALSAETIRAAAPGQIAPPAAPG